MWSTGHRSFVKSHVCLKSCYLRQQLAETHSSRYLSSPSIPSITTKPPYIGIQSTHHLFVATQGIRNLEMISKLSKSNKKCLWPPFFGRLKPWKTLVIPPNFLLTLCNFFGFHSTIICIVWCTTKIRSNCSPPSRVRRNLVVCYNNSLIAILNPASPVFKLHFWIFV